MQNHTLISTQHLAGNNIRLAGRQFTALKDINVAFQKGEFTTVNHVQQDHAVEYYWAVPG